LFNEDDFENEFAFDDEFSHAINELIKNEVIGRMQETVEELESQTQENNSLRIKVNELQRQIRNFDSELKKALKEKELEVKREFFGGFFIGDEVYVRATKGENVDCVKCNAKGTLNVLLEGEEITVKCPKCEGRKRNTIGFINPKR
jgi:regulator of replication initiation timing